MILLGIPVAFLLAILAGLYCKAHRMSSLQAKPVILMAAFAGFLPGAFGLLALGFRAWASGLVGAP